MPSQYTYYHLRPTPKSKAPFYAASPHWSNVTPIPLVEHGPQDQNPAEGGVDPGPGLATIAYSERYLEAMSYLRALLADVEFSERGLALSEDVIGMNPAHYTVWLYRMGCLREIWGVNGTGGKKGDGKGERVEEVVEDDEEKEGRNKDEELRDGIEVELQWLEVVSERNLKNYQIW